MKQLINKLFISTLFVVCMIIIPTDKVSADTVWISNNNGGNSFYATFELSFQSEGYSGLDPVGIDKYVMASGSFECIDNCWGTYLLARVENLTGDVLILAGDSAAFYGGGGGPLLNYYPGGGTTYSSTPVFYNLGWNTVTFTGQTELAQFTYQIPFFYDPLPPAVSVAVSPSSIVQGTSNNINVDWTATGADNCIEDGGRGGNGTTGSFIDYGVSDATTYSVFCYDISGSVVAYGDASVNAEVLPPAPPALSVQVFANGKSAETVPYNGTTPITWKTTGNPTSCVCSYSSPATSGSCGTGFNINGDYVAAQGAPAGLKANTTFNVTCTDAPTSPSITETYNTSAGYNPVYRIQGFQIGSLVRAGDKFSLTVFSHSVSVTAVSGDTANSIRNKLVNAVNATTATQWNDHNSAPSTIGTTSYPSWDVKPSADMMQDSSLIGVRLDTTHSFSPDVTPIY